MSTEPVVGAARVAASPLRLTRRGRVVIVFVLLALLLGVGFTLGRASQSHAADAVTHTAVVRPGDTLWSIAARVAPDRDTRQVVAEISAVNHLGSASLQVGQRLVVPS
jgi:Tfp pilus assembly protein FimV